LATAPPRGVMRYFLSARDTQARLSEQPVLQACAISDEITDQPSVWVDASRCFQTLEGFGGAFTEAAAVTWLKLSGAKREALLHAYFGTHAGHGYSLCRLHMNSCDFSLGNYAHASTVGDTSLRDFSIQRDRQALLPFIQAALRVAPQPVKLLVSPWSPPGWMKSTGQMNQGGYLLPQYRSAWARCFVRFIQAYAEEGVPIWGVTTQNEPEARQRWDSCLYTAAQERDFVRDFLGPELEKAGLAHIKIVCWDHNRNHLVERASTVYADPEASRYVWGAGFHWYGEPHFEQVQLMHDAWPDKQLLFTEGCQEGGPHADSWEVGERYAHAIINDLNRWTVGWIDWNLVLNEHGGPNHVANFCSAPVLVDTASEHVMYQSAYYYLGHFSRFIRPGAQRILCAATLQALESTAFRNPDGSVAVVVLNRQEQALSFCLKVGTHQATTTLPPRSIATYLSA